MKKFFSFVLPVILFMVSLFSQNANASFSPVYSRDSLAVLAYDTLSSGTIVNSVQSGSEDDGDIYVNLPFTFRYNGINYTRITICTNGWISMDSTTATSYNSTDFFSSTLPANTIAAWYRDNNLNTANGGLIKHGRIISGSDTIYVIEWRNVASALNGGASTSLKVNFQVWLYKTSNKIECRYGTAGPGIVTNSCVGIKDDFSGAAPHNLNALNNSSFESYTTIWCGNGNGYRFTPQTVFTNDVGVLAINQPSGVQLGINVPIAPKAVIKNFGTANQLIAFNTTCSISPGGYSSTKSDTVTSGQSNILTFDSTFVPVTGTDYVVTIYTRLSSDQNRNNDTLRTSFKLIDANYGDDAGYFYANTLATTRPSFPKYSWKDTSESKNLILNGVQAPGTLLIGDKDDGYFSLKIKDILVTLNQDTTDKHIKFSGNCYDKIFIGTNGIIGFDSTGNTSISSFNIDGALVAKYALLPLWHDFDLGSVVSSLRNRVSYKVKGDQLIITYDRVQSFSPVTDWVSFQVVIEIVTGCSSSNSNFRYTYADTTTGQTSGSFIRDYLAGNSSPSGSATTFRNYVVGFSTQGAPLPYAAYVSPLNPLPATPSTALYVGRSIYNTITRKGLAAEFGPNVNSLNEHDALTLYIALSIQGFQSNISASDRRVRDTVEITLRDASAAPYKVINKSIVYLDSAYNTIGNFPYALKYLELSLLKRNYPYYLVVRHRNSILSWSNLTSTNGDTLKYDFTTSISQTFGNNSKIVNNAASIFSGDVDTSNGGLHDGCINLTDLIRIFNDVGNFTSGNYVMTDLNWDGITNLADLVLVFNNTGAFICEVHPVGASGPVNFENEVNKNYTSDSQTFKIADPKLITKMPGMLKNNNSNFK